MEPYLFFTVPVPTFEKLWFWSQFRFRFLKGYGSGFGSYFWKVPVPVPVPAPYLDHKKQIFLLEFGNLFAFLHSKLFYEEKVYKFQRIYCKMWMKKMLNKGNQIQNLISSSGSGTVINNGSGSDFLTSYGSGFGSASQEVTVPVPVPQGCLKCWIRIRIQWIRIHNAAWNIGSESGFNESGSTTLVPGL